MVFEGFGCVPKVFGVVSYPPGSILDSVCLWCVSADRNLNVRPQPSHLEAWQHGLMCTVRHLLCHRSHQGKLSSPGPAGALGEGMGGTACLKEIWTELFGTTNLDGLGINPCVVGS